MVFLFFLLIIVLALLVIIIAIFRHDFETNISPHWPPKNAKLATFLYVIAKFLLYGFVLWMIQESYAQGGITPLLDDPGIRCMLLLILPPSIVLPVKAFLGWKLGIPGKLKLYTIETVPLVITFLVALVIDFFMLYQAL